MFVGERKGIMAVTGMHHFNIRVSQAEIGALKSFYCDILGFRVGPRPPFQSAGFWLYAGQLPVLHLTQMNSGEVAAPGSPNSLPDVRERRSAIDHVALAAADVNEAARRLTDHGVPYTLTKVPAVGEIQIFCRDPSGNGVELIFPMEGA
jgi:catechol 2,3-dioxygenase-like lactoylglutathione lyase family enzyme